MEWWCKTFSESLIIRVIVVSYHFFNTYWRFLYSYFQVYLEFVKKFSILFRRLTENQIFSPHGKEQALSVVCSTLTYFAVAFISDSQKRTFTMRLRLLRMNIFQRVPAFGLHYRYKEEILKILKQISWNNTALAFDDEAVKLNFPYNRFCATVTILGIALRSILHDLIIL